MAKSATATTSWIRGQLMLLLLLLSSTYAQQQRRTMHSSSTNDDDDDDCQLPCHIVRPEVLREDDGVPLLLSAGREEDLRCITHGRHRRGGGGGYRESLAIYLPEAFVRSNSRALARGELNVCIEGGHVEHGRIVIPGDSADLVRRIRGDDDDSSSWNNRRRLQNDKLRFGTKRLLAVRVSSSFGEVPLESGESVRGALFGTGRNPDNITDAGTVAAQYAAVTHGQLLYVPATGSNITDGVLEIKVNMLFLGNDIQNMTAAIVAQAEEAVGTLADVADNLVFCLPTGSRFGDQASWTAFTYLLEPYSYYQKSRCTRLSVVMHELGHSMGFQHSGIGDDKYNDKTGYMGFAINRLGMPHKAFNGHKHWISGWFDDRAVQVDPSTESTVHRRLVSFVDYSNDEAMFHDDVVLIKVGNLYIQYNKAKGYNMDADMPDLVTITEATSFDDVSDRLAALAEGERYAYASFDKFNNTLIIEVCSLLPFSAGNQMDYGIVSIYLDNGVQKSACNTTYTSQPTVAPSSLPTGAPATLMESTPTSAPIIVDTWTTEAPTADGNSSDALNGSDSSVPIVDNDDPVESAGSNKGGNGAKTGAILAGYVMCVLAVVAAAVYVGKKVCRSKPESLRQRNNRFVRAQSRKVWDLSDTSCNTDDGNVITETRSDGLDIAITP